MKKMRIIMAVLILGWMSGCQNQDEVPSELKIEIFDGSLTDVASVARFQDERFEKDPIRSSLINSVEQKSEFDLDNFPSENLKVINLSFEGRTNSSHAIPSNLSNNVSLNVNFDSNGDVFSAFFSKTVMNGSLRDSKLYNIDGELMIHFSVDLETREKIVYLGPSGTKSGWFDDFVDALNEFVLDTSSCLEALWTPTDIAIFDAAFVTAATHVTGGWFIPASVAACGLKVAFFD